MVADAPKFYEIARDIVELTKNKIFVAHNVHFDYNFLRSEFERLGYYFKRERLCTVRLSHRIIPGLPSYSLGNLCSELNIPLNGRHRARGDALATVKLLELLIERNGHQPIDHFSKAIKRNYALHPRLDMAVFDRLPESPGVYYFYNEQSELIYIGKSKNIRSRVMSHFSGSSSRKAIEMCSRTADIGYETTGNELIALLRESFEIKRHMPYYNRAQKRASFQYGIYASIDERGYIRLALERTKDMPATPIACFSLKSEARQFLSHIIDKYELCQKLCGVYSSSGSCFHFEIGSCRGACTGREIPGRYNIRAEKAIRDCSFEYGNLLIIDQGRNNGERSAVKLENGKYIGYGYFDFEYAAGNPGIISECITSFPDSREIRHIIRQYLRSHSVEKLLVF
jgi:DNA polymerase-3 subunit epsilon